MISAILLAAGESRRMGRFKQLLPLGNKSFVEHCVDNLLASRVDEVIIVTGHREADVRSIVADRPVRFAHNDDYRSGMASSIKCGVRSLTEDSRAVVLALVDQPQIGVEVINLVIDAFERGQASIVIPTYDGKGGHPIVLDAALKEEILNMDLEQGLRQIVRAHSDEVSRVGVSSRVILEDFDLPEDYEHILNR
ncbi:MAG TPA: nucleotidyltransferase family protein [Blastocatellia bacterium]|nr:nucleotidyltransferase family protein [Blastocatellia bacterium]